MRYLKAFNESAFERSFTITGKIESIFPNGQKTPDFYLSSFNKTLSGTPIKFDRSINKYSIPQDVEVTIIGTTKDGNPSWNNPIYVSRIEDIIVNEGSVKKYNSFRLVSENTELKCLNCKSDLKPTTKFCTKCGIKVGIKDEKSTERTKNESESSFSQKLKKIRSILYNDDYIKVFDKDVRYKTEELLNDIEQIYKTDKLKGELFLDNQVKFISNMVNHFIDYKDSVQKKISKIEQEQINLKNKNDDYNKKLWSETFKPLLDECKKNYQLLKDQNVKSKLNDLFSIIVNNFNDGNYHQAINGASRLVVTFFPDGKTFNGWDNKSTDLNLSSDGIVAVLDDYKKIIQEGK